MGSLIFCLLTSFILLNFLPLHIECTCDCVGYKSDCINETCTCPSDYDLHDNGRDCKQKSCNITDCLECETDTLCSKCVHYLAEGRQACLTECSSHTTYDKNDNGPICISDIQGCTTVKVGGKDEGSSTDVVIGIIAGVSASLFRN